MRSLGVRLEIDGQLVEVGKLFCEGVNRAHFAYDAHYLQQARAQAISISLPLRTEDFSYAETRNYFEGLLPEGFTRRSVAQCLKVNEEDYLSILASLGLECIGALQIVSDTNVDVSHYEKLTEQEVRNLANEGATKSASLMLKTHLSLAGASGKAGLYYTQGKWYLPKGLAASSHIVKQSHVRLKEIVTNEQLTMLTAKKLGINTAESFIVNLGQGGEGEILYATKRYDRCLARAKRQIDGLPCPLRLHQEDFAQALGISSKAKYELEGAGYVAKVFNLLKQVSADPLLDILELWRRLIFNYLIGNTDGHIKNYSLLYDCNIREVRLAPAYDMLSTTIYERSSDALSMAIGGESKVEKITWEHISHAAAEAGLKRQVGLNIAQKLQREFKQALLQAAQELEQAGFRETLSLAERILATGGIAYLAKH